jgi:two-component system, NarL family, sensor histidine kinase EvgS
LQSGSGMYHFAVRKDWAALATILNKGILRYRAEAQGAAWAAATASLPASVAMTNPMPLSDGDNALLAQLPVWRVGAVRGLAMLNEVDDKGLHSGIAAEYTEHVARRLGVGIEVVPFDNVAAMLDGLRQGRIDFIPFLTRTEERSKEFGFSEPYFEMPYMLVGRSDAPLYWDLGSLKGRRLALALAHPLRESVAQKYPEIHVLDARNGNEAMDMVARGEADAAVEVKVFANLRINDDPTGRLRALGAVGDLPAQFRFAAGRDARVLLPLLDRALGEISPSERERMSRRWVAIDFNPPFPWRKHLPVIAVSGGALLSIALGTFWWMRRLAREVQARRRSDEQLYDIGRTLPCAAFRDVQDAGGRIRRRFFSSGSQRFLGIEPKPGQAVIDALLPQLGEPDAALLSQMQARHLNEDLPLTFTGLYAHPDGRNIWLHVEAVRTRNGGDKVSTGYAVDVSAERHLQEELSKQAKEKHLLLASASHELRAPTHTLSLALQSIPTDGLPGSSVRGLRIAGDAARTLGQLLDDVLDVARFDSGHAELRPQDFDLRALIDQIRDAHAGAMAAKGLKFQCNVAADIPQMVCLDPLRVRQVLTNLLSNAARYTAHGGVDLRVSRARQGPGGQQAEVTMLEFLVSDTGQGLSPERQIAPFEAYGRIAQAEGSTGLGLSICQRFVQMMGGEIRLHSQPGQGTQVHVLLPVNVRPPRSASPQVPVRHEGDLLLCDDDPVCRMLVAEGLSQRGYAVVQVGGGEEALARWRRGGVRALITDLSMPGLGGATLIDTVLAEEAGRPERTAVLICSGDLAPLVSATQALPPHDAFLTKPVDVGTLVKALSALGLTGAAKH